MKTKVLSAIERCELVTRVINAVNEQIESPEHSERIGWDLAWVFACVCDLDFESSTMDLTDSEELVELLRNTFPPDDEIWQFIECLPADPVPAE